jgi:hypothetical protein
MLFLAEVCFDFGVVGVRTADVGRQRQEGGGEERSSTNKTVDVCF